MDPLAKALLVLIALVSVVQTVALAFLAREGWRTARRLDDAALRLGRDVSPALAEATRALRNVGEIAELTAEQARLLDGLMGQAAHALGAARGIVEEIVIPVTARAATAAAALRLLRRAGRTYRRWRRRR